MGIALLAFFFAFPFVYSAGNYDYIMHICIVGFFYAILASSWSMLAGYAGQFSFGHMAFMGLGAYTAALFCHYFFISPEPTGICTEFALGSNYLIINFIKVALCKKAPSPGQNPIGITGR